jgi:hypothetical protein
LTESIVEALEDTNHHTVDHHDFSDRLFDLDKTEHSQQESELHWHLEYLQNNPSAARELLMALMPEQDARQGDWSCNYRLLQSTETMPLVYDCAWLMNGQYAFYILDTASVSECGVATTLLLRALFHEYVRNRNQYSVDLKELADTWEKGVKCADCCGEISAIMGVVDFTEQTISILPAGLDAQWRGQHQQMHIQAGVRLGQNCLKNFITKDLPLNHGCQVAVGRLGMNSFTLDISRVGHH